LFEKYEIRELYSEDFSGMYKHIKIFKFMLKKYLIKIHDKFQEVDFEPDVYMMNWILTFM